MATYTRAHTLGGIIPIFALLALFYASTVESDCPLSYGLPCGGNGRCENGACVCESDYYGEACECDRPEEACIAPGSQRVCSNHGSCICGQCMCDIAGYLGSVPKYYSGQYCECDDHSCDYYNQQICGGHGICSCGRCQCEPGFTGVACHCPLATDNCIASNGLICNGRGSCECGECNCNRDFYYYGPTCEDCPTCA